MCRNADSLYYPIEESILSILPIVDEFVIAVGKGTSEDRTLEIIRGIDSQKIRIIETEWDVDTFPRGTVHAQQTDLAKSHCKGDWLIYLQADEVIHEKDHKAIQDACHYHLDNLKVEGFLFNFLHFWGDYQHYQNSHTWYEKEIRVIRNREDIHSWISAQSFRVIPDFNGRSYRKKGGTRKLRVVAIDASVYHYGWVRPPEIMIRKMNELDRIHSHKSDRYEGTMVYGELKSLPEFKGTHPDVMSQRIAKMDWQDHPHAFKNNALTMVKHLKWRAQILSFFERKFLRGYRLFTQRNYDIWKP